MVVQTAITEMPFGRLRGLMQEREMRKAVLTSPLAIEVAIANILSLPHP